MESIGLDKKLNEGLQKKRRIQYFQANNQKMVIQLPEKKSRAEHIFFPQEKSRLINSVWDVLSLKCLVRNL